MDEKLDYRDFPQQMLGVKEECFKVTDPSHTKLFFPAITLASQSTSAAKMPNTVSSITDNVSNAEFIVEQKKAFQKYEQLPSNSDKNKRIQKAKEEIALDDWSTIDESMLDNETQEKLLNEAKQMKNSTSDSYRAKHSDSEDEVLQLWLEQIDGIIENFDGAKKDQPHNNHPQRDKSKSYASSDTMSGSSSDHKSTALDGTLHWCKYSECYI